MSDLTCLNASQREAVTFGEGPLLLLAGPGSGKTFTITQRILYLIRERRITPEKLLVITFTREAALSMRQRFAQISPQEVHTVNFGTFHSVFYQILLQSGRISSGNILNDRQKRDLILPILKKITDCRKRSAAEVTELAGNYLAAIGYYKNTGDIENSRKKLPEEEKERFLNRRKIGICPVCGRAVYEGKKSYYCSNPDCRFVLWKENRYLVSMRKVIDPALAENLLEKGRARVRDLYSARKGTTFEADLCMEYQDERVQFRLEFPPRKKQFYKKGEK